MSQTDLTPESLSEAYAPFMRVRLAGEDEIAAGTAVPVIITITGTADDQTAPNFLVGDIEPIRLYFMSKDEAADFNAGAEQFIREHVLQDTEIIVGGMMCADMNDDGDVTAVELRYCEDMFSGGIPDSRTLTLIRFTEADRDTVILARSETREWIDYTVTRVAFELLRKFSEFLEDAGVDSDDADVISEQFTEDADMLPSEQTSLVFSGTSPRQNMYFFSGEGELAQVTVTTDILENGIRWPDGGSFKVSYKVEVSGMTVQRAQLTVDVKPKTAS